MLSGTENSLVREPSSDNTSVLLVSPRDEDEKAVQEILQQPEREVQWTIKHCDGAKAAASSIHSIMPGVVLCDRKLPDGDWKDVLHACQDVAKPPLFVVYCDGADERLWAEVLNQGGFDVLSRPLKDSEVTGTMTTAWRYRFGQLPGDAGAWSRHIA